MGKKNKQKFTAIETIYMVKLVSHEHSVLGDDEYKMELEAISESDGIQGHAAFTLWLTPEQLRSWNEGRVHSADDLQRKRMTLGNAGLL